MSAPFKAGEYLPGVVVSAARGRVSFRVRPRTAIVCAVLAGAVLVGAVVALMTGTFPLSVGEVWNTLHGFGERRANTVIFSIRLPRLIAGIFVGACLGVSGAVFQSLSRNPLGSPDIIGFVSGAATGAIVQILFFNGGPIAVSLTAVVSGLITAAIVYLLSMKGKATGGYRLVLVGIGVGAILQAANSLILTRSSDDIALAAQLWLTGSLNARTWNQAVPVVVAFIVLTPILLLASRRMNLLELGDDISRQLGVQAERTRMLMMVAGIGLIAAAVAAAGPISFVALAAPHIVRQITRSPTIPILPAALMGSVLLLGADLLSQHLPLGIAAPVGLLTGLIGGIYLIWMLARTTRL